ncbi:MAG TPA: DUF3107 domain-containing protein [Dermatophilaceae bacterium]|nr:DUF3107 domain-containing protein [Dermatophilaceae bacterium]
MEIKIGIQHVNREIVIESTESAPDVEKAFADALAGEGLFTLTDEHGRKVMVQARAVGYLDIGEENARRVGFGSV